jgi:hypothetical protein
MVAAPFWRAMMIAAMKDSLPKVARFEGDIAIYVPDPASEEDNHGFLLPPSSASTVALKMLRAVGDATGATDFVHDVSAIELSGGSFGDDDAYAHLTLTIDTAPLRVVLTAQQVAELAVAFAAAARQLDAPRSNPRADR